MRAFSTRKYPRQIIVKDEYIVSVKLDDRGFIVHKWTKKIVDLKQVYLVVKDNRRIYQLALEFVQRPGEKNAFTDVLQFDPATSRNFTQLISTARKELLGNPRGRSGAAEPQRFSDKYGEEIRRTVEPSRPAAAPEPPRAMNSFESAIANANANRGAAAAATAGVQPAPAPTAFTPATAAVSDPFAGSGAFVPAPAAPQSPSPPSSVSGPFNAMMQSVNANGHQMEALFTPPERGVRRRRGCVSGCGLGSLRGDGGARARASASDDAGLGSFRGDGVARARRPGEQSLRRRPRTRGVGGSVRDAPAATSTEPFRRAASAAAQPFRVIRRVSGTIETRVRNARCDDADRVRESISRSLPLFLGASLATSYTLSASRRLLPSSPTPPTVSSDLPRPLACS